jgi:putative SOS response-associated peptidase YedK
MDAPPHNLRPRYNVCPTDADVFDREEFAPWLSREAGAGILMPVPNDYLQRWQVSKRVNSSKADADDPTLIERVDLAVA